MAEERQILLDSNSRYGRTGLVSRPANDKNPAQGKRVYFSTWGAYQFPETDNDVWVPWEGSWNGRLDLLASKYYGDYSLWWAIASANRILDPLAVQVPGTMIRIPALSVVRNVLLQAQGG